MLLFCLASSALHILLALGAVAPYYGLTLWPSITIAAFDVVGSVFLYILLRRGCCSSARGHILPHNHTRGSSIIQVYLHRFSKELNTSANALANAVRAASFIDKSSSSNILSCVSEITDSVRDFVDLYRIESGELLLCPNVFLLRTMLDSLRNEFEIDANRLSISFDLTTSLGVPKTMVGDHVRIKQILSHLIKRAFKAVEQASVTKQVTVAVESVGFEGGAVKFLVTDSGYGTTHVDLPDVAGGPAARRRASMGVQRTTSDPHATEEIAQRLYRQMAEKMGGTLTVNNHATVGTTVELSLPLQPASTKHKTNHRSPSSNGSSPDNLLPHISSFVTDSPDFGSFRRIHSSNNSPTIKSPPVRFQCVIVPPTTGLASQAFAGSSSDFDVNSDTSTPVKSGSGKQIKHVSINPLSGPLRQVDSKSDLLLPTAPASSTPTSGASTAAQAGVNHATRKQTDVEPPGIPPKRASDQVP